MFGVTELYVLAAVAGALVLLALVWVRRPVPHLTLDRTGPGVSVASTLSSLADVVPARGRAEELLLTWWESDRCRVLGAAPLGGSTN